MNSHAEDRDEEITGININLNAFSTVVNMSVCTSIGDIQAATCEDAHMQMHRLYILQDWQHKKTNYNTASDIMVNKKQTGDD